MVLAVVGSGVYKTFLYLHILTAIVGFGAVMVNAVYAAESRERPGPEGRALCAPNRFGTGIAQCAFFAVFLFGRMAAIIGNPAVKFSQAWLTISMVLYIIG